MAVTDYPSLVFTMGGAEEGMDLFHYLDNVTLTTLDGRWGLGSFTVYINGEETDQEADSITAAEGDQVEIAMTGGQECFPVFNLCHGETGYAVASIDEPLPLLGTYPEASAAICKTYLQQEYCSLFGAYESDGISKLTSVCEGLFGNNTQLTDLSYCFYGCAALVSVPEDVFSCLPAATDFSRCFTGCSSLPSLPEGLFASNPLAETFSWCLSGCSGITAVPEGLFASSPLAADLSYCFHGCGALGSVPEGLFAGNTAIQDLQGCFSGCSSLAEVPEGLLEDLLAVTNAAYCFSGCSSLSLTARTGAEDITWADYFAYGCAGEAEVHVLKGSVTEETFAAAVNANAALRHFMPPVVTFAGLTRYHSALTSMLGETYATADALAESEGEMTALGERVSAIESDNATGTELSALEEDVAALDSRVSAIEDDNATGTELAALDGRVAELEADSAGFRSTVAAEEDIDEIFS